jgi:hypothetical protein
MLERSEQLDKLIEFVTDADNMTGLYKDARYFGVSHRSILGLHSGIKADKLVQFFMDGGDPTKELTDEQIKTLGGDKLLSDSQRLAKRHMGSQERLAILKDRGFIVDTPHGKLVIDIDGEGKKDKKKTGSVDDMAFAVSSYDIHLSWRPQARQFFRISGMPREVSLGAGQGRGIRIRNMWLKPHEDKGDLTITVAEILTAFGFDPKQATGDLRKFLDGGEVVTSAKPRTNSRGQKDGGNLRWHGSEDDDRSDNYGDYAGDPRKKKKKQAA